MYFTTYYVFTKITKCNFFASYGMKIDLFENSHNRSLLSAWVLLYQPQFVHRINASISTYYLLTIHPGAGILQFTFDTWNIVFAKSSVFQVVFIALNLCTYICRMGLISQLFSTTLICQIQYQRDLKPMNKIYLHRVLRLILLLELMYVLFWLMHLL